MARQQLDLDLDELMEQHGGYWGEHPDHPSCDWRFEVANEDTRMGYWEWVESRVIDAKGQISART